jgi:glycerol-3-phosphate acyltransferase PlsY
MGLWLPMFPIAFGLGALIWFSIGIASLTTMAIGLVLIIIFAFQASQGNLPSIYILYGIIAESLLVWALRPNIKKLLAGNERVIGTSLNGWLKARKQAKEQAGKS